MISIAIDGPSGAGKSTIAKLTAQTLGYIYVDTGALYRAIALYMLENGVDIHDSEAVCAHLKAVEVSLRHIDGSQRVLLCGRDVTREIREHSVSAAASKVSAIPRVREFLLELQRSAAGSADIVMDGRDIGTVVLPQASVKIFLTADVEDRARRRFEELEQSGKAVDYETVLRDIRQRDHDDSTRAVSPLRQADDAVLVDTTGNTLEQSAELVLGIIRDRLRSLGRDVPVK